MTETQAATRRSVSLHIKVDFKKKGIRSLDVWDLQPALTPVRKEVIKKKKRKNTKTTGKVDGYSNSTTMQTEAKLTPSCNNLC